MKLIFFIINFVFFLVFLGVGTRFMKFGFDVRFFVWDYFIFFNIILLDKSIVVKRIDRGKRKLLLKFKIF